MWRRCWLQGVRGAGAETQPTANPAVTISGASQARLGSTVQLTATVTNTSNTAVTWQVNGVAGGSSATGTISATGLYTPPATIPSPNTVTITAVTQATPVASASHDGVDFESDSGGDVGAGDARLLSARRATTLDVMGTGFISTSQMQVGGSDGAGDVCVFDGVAQHGTITVATGATTVAVVVTNPDPGTMTCNCYAQVVNLKASLHGGGAAAGPGDLWADAE